MLRFTAADLIPVLSEARANQCAVLLVKDQSLYLMSAVGEYFESGRRRHIAYAAGCQDEQDIQAEWVMSRAGLSEGDFTEVLDADYPVFDRVLETGCDLDLLVMPDALHFFTALSPQAPNRKK